MTYGNKQTDAKSLYYWEFLIHEINLMVRICDSTQIKPTRIPSFWYANAWRALKMHFTFMSNEHWAVALHLHVWWTGDLGRGKRSEIPNKFSGKQTMPHPVHGNTLTISAAETKLEDARGENTIDAKCSTQIWIRVRFRIGWDRTEWLRAFDMFSLQMHTHTMRL